MSSLNIKSLLCANGYVAVITRGTSGIGLMISKVPYDHLLPIPIHIPSELVQNQFSLTHDRA
ncbi:hypothetical protein CC80DRAFT_488596 [Byssothecium circinans]|uniref:Uncharacterized protein n=1 Tax=Byssothecium circinans TaxID=147558 RepID=A0A6A5U9C5_9PLEO|nr:hypothetical protein CC80DRAFT_488596 [Byssothecium circinans]